MIVLGVEDMMNHVTRPTTVADRVQSVAAICLTTLEDVSLIHVNGGTAGRSHSSVKYEHVYKTMTKLDGPKRIVNI